MFAVIFTAMNAGNSESSILNVYLLTFLAATFTPNIAKAKIAASSIFEILDRVPEIDSSADTGFDPKREDTIGLATGTSVCFSYPTRPNVPVLKGLAVTASPGQTVALVGASGSGKSTIISLLERFYDSISGDVAFDREDVKKWKLKALRSHLSLVGQEPGEFLNSLLFYF